MGLDVYAKLMIGMPIEIKELDYEEIVTRYDEITGEPKQKKIITSWQIIVCETGKIFDYSKSTYTDDASIQEICEKEWKGLDIFDFNKYLFGGNTKYILGKTIIETSSHRFTKEVQNAHEIDIHTLIDEIAIVNKLFKSLFGQEMDFKVKIYLCPIVSC